MQPKIFPDPSQSYRKFFYAKGIEKIIWFHEKENRKKFLQSGIRKFFAEGYRRVPKVRMDLGTMDQENVVQVLKPSGKWTDNLRMHPEISCR